MGDTQEQYTTVGAHGAIRVIGREAEVGLNVFGTYAFMSPSAGRLLAQAIWDKAEEADALVAEYEVVP